MIDGILVPVTTAKLLAKFKQYYYEDGTPIPKSDITGNLGDDMIAELSGKNGGKKTNKRRSKKRKTNKTRSKKRKTTKRRKTNK
jgi:hypothetical protein